MSVIEVQERGRDLTGPELRELALGLADQPELWAHLVHHDPAARVYEELLQDDHVAIWLICWMQDHDTGFHDHDLSAGGVAVGLALPAAAGYLLSGTWRGALTGLIWGGLVRVFLLHHVTFSINSICHFFGTRRFETDDHSTNVFWLAIPSLGEAWHNNHHAFPRSARHGLRWWEIDLGSILIRTLRRLGLAWDVVEISPERQVEKQRSGASFARGTAST